MLKVISGEKTWELRYDDRGYQVGDILELLGYIGSTGEYTGVVCWREVTYVFRPEDESFQLPLPPGWVIMSIVPCQLGIADATRVLNAETGSVPVGGSEVVVERTEGTGTD